MLRLALGAAFVLSTTGAGGQRVPGRDLLTHPLGLIGEAPALGSGAGSGLWNPATSVLEPGEHGRLAATALSAPIDVALSGQAFHGAIARTAGTFSLSLVRAAIADLVHTETDPQSVGNDIPYNTWVVSAGFARRV